MFLYALHGVSQCLCSRVETFKKFRGEMLSWLFHLVGICRDSSEQVVLPCRYLWNELTHTALNGGFCACLTQCVCSAFCSGGMTVLCSHRVITSIRGTAQRYFVIVPRLSSVLGLYLFLKCPKNDRRKYSLKNKDFARKT